MGSFVSIVVIALLAVTVYLGIAYSSRAMDENVSHYYNLLNTQDLQVFSAALLTKDDAEAVRALDGVSDVEGSFETVAWVPAEDDIVNVTVISMPERIAVPEVTRGHEPRGGDECMIEALLSKQLGLSMGDTIHLQDKAGGVPPLMTKSDFTITGIFDHPDHVTDKIDVTPYVIVPDSTFDRSILYGDWTRLRIRLADLPENRFTKGYTDAVAPVVQALKELSDVRMPVRVAEVRGNYQQKIDDGEKQLADAKAKLDDAADQIADAEKQLEDGRTQLAEGEKKLADAEQKILDGEKQIADNEKQIADGEKQLAEGEKQLADAENKIADGEKQLADGEKQLADGEKEYADGEKQLSDGEKQLADGEKQLSDAEKQLADARSHQADYEAQYNKGLEELADAERRLNLAPGQLADAELKLNEARRKLDGTKEDIDTGYHWLKKQDPTPQDVEALKKFIEKEYHVDTSEIPNNIFEMPEDEALKIIYRVTGLTAKEAEWERGRIDYYYSGEEYLDGLTAYEKGKKRLEAAREAMQKLQEAEEQIKAKKAELEEGRQKLEESRKQLMESRQQLDDGKKQVDENRQQLEDGRKQLEENRRELEENRQKLEDGKKQLEDGKKQLEESRKLLEDSRQQLEDGKLKQADGEHQLAEKKKEYEAGLTAYNENRESLNQLENQDDNLDSLSWAVLTNRSNGGFVYAESNSKNLSSLSSSFSLMFVAIAALVIYASVARMVDEQSVLVGTTKALGFHNKEVSYKYLLFGLLSTMTGVIAGILLAYFGLQSLVLKMYAPYYIVPRASRCFLIGPTVMLFVGGFLVALAAVLFASYKLIKLPAVELMKGKQPDAKHAARTNNSGSLYARLILLNMSSDLTRVIVTVVSIAGCCILLMVGFTLKFGEDRIVNRQYGEVMTFDAELHFDPENETIEQEMIDLFGRKGVDYLLVHQESRAFSDGDDMSACTLICAEPDALPGWCNLRDAETDAGLTEPEHGVLIAKRMHETYALNEGDIMTFYSSDMTTSVATVSGVFNNYFGQLIFVSPDSYREIFGSDPEQNCFYLKLNGNDFKSLRRAGRLYDGFLSLDDAASRREQIETTAKAMNVLIIVMIAAAGLMAWFILDNLSGSYMIHKKRELTVMRVNGFSVGECIRYAATELIITSVLGILIGIPLGAAFGYRVIRLTEQSFMQMDRTLDIRSVIFSVLITVAFTLIINGLALSKVRDLKLSDAAN